MANPPGQGPASGATIRGALVYSAAGTYLQLFMQTLTTLIVARLITPTDLALFAIGSSVVALVQVLRDFGIASYVIRERELTNEALSTTFLVSAGLCWTLAGILFATAGPLGTFYGDRGVTDVLRVLSLGITLVPFGSISQAVLQRRFDFRRVFVIVCASSVVHAAASIVLAMYGFRHMALAWASVLGVATTAITTRLVAGRVFRLTFRLHNVRSLFTFGQRMTQIQIVRVVYSRSPQLILGKALPLPDLGIFERANGVMEMFDRLVMQAVDPLVMPYFSDKARGGHGLAQATVAATSAVASVAVPFFAFIATSAYPFVEVLFGSTWMPAAQYVPYLCLAAALRVPSTFVNRLGVVLDRLDVCLRTFVLSTVVQVLALLICAPLGLTSICIGIAVAALIHTAIWAYASRLFVGTSGVAAAVRAAWFPTLLVLAATGAINVYGARAELPALVVLTAASAAAGIVWLFAMRVTGNVLYDEIRRAALGAWAGLGLRKV